MTVVIRELLDVDVIMLVKISKLVVVDVLMLVCVSVKMLVSVVKLTSTVTVVEDSVFITVEVCKTVAWTSDSVVVVQIDVLVS